MLCSTFKFLPPQPMHPTLDAHFSLSPWKQSEYTHPPPFPSKSSRRGAATFSSLMPELTVFVLGLEFAVTLPLVVAVPSDLSAALPLCPFSGSIASV